MYFPEYRCSGFRPAIATELKAIFNDNRNIFQIAHQVDNHLFTHAGVTTKWLNWAKDDLNKYGFNDNLDNIAETLNIMNETNQRWLINNVGYQRGGLRGDFGGPTWADKKETCAYAVPNLIQYVGHTPVDDIQTNDNNNVTYCDVLAHTNNTLIINI